MGTGGGNKNAQLRAQNPQPSLRVFSGLFSPWISVPREQHQHYDRKRCAWKSAHSEHAYLKTISGLFLCP